MRPPESPRKKPALVPDSRKGEQPAVAPARALALAAIGLEAEFTLTVDGAPTRPERHFRSPQSFVRQRLMHRVGTSYHLPTGGAVYFDTGVVEVATPVIEIERGCAERAGRSLWEAIRFIRQELDAWERRRGVETRLVGFSAHYNISFEMPEDEQTPQRNVEQLALLLAHLLPFPVMLLATNRRSTGVGVRPRGDRIEVTVDFTPSAALMIATAAFITGVARAVMQWPSFDLSALDDHALPVPEDYAPVPHTSRKGWLARHDAFRRNPFETPPHEPAWSVRPAFHEARGTTPAPLSMREIATVIATRFDRPIRRIADPFTYRLLHLVLSGHAPSLLDLPDRPEAYEDVGRLCFWDDLFPDALLARSRYERVMIRAINEHVLILRGRHYHPVGMHGWSEVVFRRADDGTRHRIPIDTLVTLLDRWERT